MGALPRAGAVFAGSIMLIIGLFGVVQGVAGLLQDSFFVIEGDYAYEIDITAWAWGHLILGIIVAAAGGFIFTGALWARLIGIVVAVLSAAVNFVGIPYYPFWSLLVIALNIVAIWGLTVQPRDTSLN
jgi:hypothetical protein